MNGTQMSSEQASRVPSAGMVDMKLEVVVIPVSDVDRAKRFYGGLIAVILGNRTMIDAYRAGAPGNGKPFPDGSRMAKIHWNPKKNEAYPGQPTVPGTQHDVDFMVKDSKRFADSGGWGYAVFDYDAASDTFKPGTAAGTPPQGNDAKCGFACHTKAKTRDYVFTEYGKR